MVLPVATGFDDPGIYLLDPCERGGLAPRTWASNVPDLDDDYYWDWTGDELAEFYPGVAETKAKLEAVQMMPRTFKDGHYVIFYRY